MANTIEFIIKATDQASVTVDKIEAKILGSNAAIGKSYDETANLTAASSEKAAKGIGELGDASDKSSIQIGGIQGALVTLQAGIAVAQVAVEAFKKVWDFSKEGAAVQRIGEQFNAVAADFGVSGEAMVAAMDKAARGTVDDEELMTVATRAMTQGTITSQDQLVKFTEIARASAVRFGGDTAQALQSILYATEVGAARQLKATIGVVDFTKAYDQLAAKMGKRKQDLTDEEQLQARVNAVLDKGAELVKKVGDTGDDAATKMARFETRLADIVDTIKSNAATGLVGITDIISDLGVQLDANASKQDKLRSYINSLVAQGFDPESQVIKTLNETLVNLSDSTDEVSNTTRNLSEPFRAVAGAMVDTSNAAKDLADKFAKSSQGIHNQAAEFDGAVMATKRYNDTLAATAKQLDITNFSVGNNLSKSTAEYTAKQDELQKKSGELAAEIEKLESTQGRAVTTTSKNTMTTAELAKAQFDAETTSLKLSEAQKRLNDNTDPAKTRELQGAVIDLTAKYEDQKGKIDKTSGAVTGYIDNSKKISELKGQYDTINKEIANNAAQYEEANKRILLTIIEQRLARGDWTDKEVTAYTTVAKQLGLFDEKSAMLFKNIMNATDKLEAGGSIDAFTKQVTANAELMNQAATGAAQSATGAAQTVGAIPEAIRQARDESKEPIVVKADADVKQVRDKTAEVKEILAKARNPEPIQIRATAETKEARDKIIGLQEEAAGARNQITVRADADTTAARDKIIALNEETRNRETTFNVNAKTDDAQRRILDLLGIPTDKTIKVDADTEPTKKKMFELFDLGTQPVIVRTVADTAEARDKLIELQEKSKSATDLKVTADTTDAAKRLAALANPIRVPVSADTAGAKGEIDKYQEKKDKAALPVVTPFKADTAQASGDVSRYDFQIQSIPSQKETVMSIVADEALAIAQNLLNLQSQFKDKTVTWTVNEVNKSSGGPVAGAQSGADFVVPPGFAGDRFPLMVSSGERVIVMTPAQQQQGLPGNSAPLQRVTNNVNNFYDTLATKMWIEKQRQDDLDALVARM